MCTKKKKTRKLKEEHCERKKKNVLCSHNKCEAAILMIPFGQTTVYLLYSLYTERLFAHIHIRSLMLSSLWICETFVER